MPKLKLFAVSMFRHGADLHSYRSGSDFCADPGHSVDIIEAESLSRAKEIAFAKHFPATGLFYEPSINAVEILRDLIDKHATPRLSQPSRLERMSEGRT